MKRLLIGGALLFLIAGCAAPNYQGTHHYSGQRVVTGQDQIRGLRQTGCQLWGAVGQANTWNSSTYNYACYVPSIMGL